VASLAGNNGGGAKVCLPPIKNVTAAQKESCTNECGGGGVPLAADGAEPHVVGGEREPHEDLA
jgi:hypothetical protein